MCVCVCMHSRMYLMICVRLGAFFEAQQEQLLLGSFGTDVSPCRQPFRFGKFFDWPVAKIPTRPSFSTEECTALIRRVDRCCAWVYEGWITMFFFFRVFACVPEKQSNSSQKARPHQRPAGSFVISFVVDVIRACVPLETRHVPMPSTPV